MKTPFLKKFAFLNYIGIFFICTLFFFATHSNCPAQNQSKNLPITKTDLLSKTNLLKNAHNSPSYSAAATTPFGMMQMGAEYVWPKKETIVKTTKSLDSIYGFFVTHPIALNKNITGDFMVLPLTDTFNLSHKIQNGIGFQTKSEQAKPGFYAVTLNNNMDCRFTCDKYAGIQEFTFKSNYGWLQWQLKSPLSEEEIINGSWEIINENTLAGYKESQKNTNIRNIFMIAQFSQPINKFIFNNTTKGPSKVSGKNIVALLGFNTLQPLTVKISISYISSEQALENLQIINKSTFAQLKTKSTQLWENELKKITIQTENLKLQQTFLNALYYNLIAPENMVEQGQIFGTPESFFNLDSGQTAYYSNWNSNNLFKSKISLLNFLNPNVVQDFTKTLWLIYKQTGSFPEQLDNTNHLPELLQEGVIPILTETIIKDYNGLSYDSLFDALKNYFQNKYNHFNTFFDEDFVPYDTFKNNVALSLNFAYEAWCLSQVALKLQLKNDYIYYLKKSQLYKNIWNQETLFFQPKNKFHLFYKNFDPFLDLDKLKNPYFEGNAWQNNYDVIHDFNGYVTLYGSIDNLLKRLDSLFFVEKNTMVTTSKPIQGTYKATLNKNKIDSSNLVNNKKLLIPKKLLPLGQYNQYFQSLHHVPYIPSLINRLDISSKYLKKICDSFYLSDNKFSFENDGSGQMNSWFIWTCLGLYPLNPVDGNLVFGFPMIDGATIILPNMRLLKIVVDNKNKNPESKIQEVYFNNVKLRYNYIHYTSLLQGGVLKYIIN